MCQIGDERLPVFLIDDGSDRHAHDGVVAVRASHIAAHAALAVLRLHMLLKAVVDQRVEILDRLGPDIAAATAIPTIPSAEPDELFAPERHAAIPALAARDVDLCGIEKFH